MSVCVTPFVVILGIILDSWTGTRKLSGPAPVYRCGLCTDSRREELDAVSHVSLFCFFRFFCMRWLIWDSEHNVKGERLVASHTRITKVWLRVGKASRICTRLDKTNVLQRQRAACRDLLGFPEKHILVYFKNTIRVWAELKLNCTFHPQFVLNLPALTTACSQTL